MLHSSVGFRWVLVDGLLWYAGRIAGYLVYRGEILDDLVGADCGR